MEQDNCALQQYSGFHPLEVAESSVCQDEDKAVGACSGPAVCQCPRGVGGRNCQQCLTNFWAYTSFGCRGIKPCPKRFDKSAGTCFAECNCNTLGSESSSCEPQTGVCLCKPGYAGDKCGICPDGTLADVTGCSKGSTRYEEPIPCGEETCNFGATCKTQHGGGGEKRCVCEINCRNPMYFREVRKCAYELSMTQMVAFSFIHRLSAEATEIPTGPSASFVSILAGFGKRSP